MVHKIYASLKFTILKSCNNSYLPHDKPLAHLAYLFSPFDLLAPKYFYLLGFPIFWLSLLKPNLTELLIILYFTIFGSLITIGNSTLHTTPLLLLHTDWLKLKKYIYLLRNLRLNCDIVIKHWVDGSLLVRSKIISDI